MSQRKWDIEKRFIPCTGVNLECQIESATESETFMGLHAKLYDTCVYALGLDIIRTHICCCVVIVYVRWGKVLENYLVK
jgi:hypothetical protein